MKTIYQKTISRIGVLLAAAAAFILINNACAQDSLVGFGRVTSGGVLAVEVSAVGGTISVGHIADGTYEIEFSSPGAFVGLTPDDFHIGITMWSNGSDDYAAVTRVDSLTDNFLRVNVYVGDMEDSTNTSAAELRDWAFYFQVHRIVPGGTVSPRSNYVVASGRVDETGDIQSWVTAHGMQVASVEGLTGEYDVVINAPGFFVGDNPNSYSIALCADGTSVDDNLVAGEMANFGSDDEVTLKVYTVDAQSDLDDDNSHPAHQGFSFIVYSNVAPPVTSLLTGMARVDGLTGDLLSSATALPGGVVSSHRLGNGEYRVVIQAAGAFVGKTTNSYSLQIQSVTLGGVDDVVPSGRLTVLDSDTAQIDVFMGDVESPGGNADLEDQDFSLMVVSSEAELGSDLMIGKKLSSLQDQILKVRVKKNGKGKFFYRTENSGNLTRDLGVALSGKSKGYKLKHFLVTGGRSNITAAMKSSDFVKPNMAPGELAAFETKVKRKRNAAPRRAKFRFAGIDSRTGATQDLVQAKLKPSRK